MRPTDTEPRPIWPRGPYTKRRSRRSPRVPRLRTWAARPARPNSPPRWSSAWAPRSRCGPRWARRREASGLGLFFIDTAPTEIYTSDPDGVRAFFRDVLKLPSVDAGGG